jgi:decaprenylphospho-beta-D-ribofuranose 2-oxidase
MSRELLYGWGLTAPGNCELRTVYDEAQVLDQLSKTTHTIARGLGRSYGDPAQVSGGVVLNNRGLCEIGRISDEGVVTVGAGASIDELLQLSIPLGWFVPVTAGTRQITIGGAIAADVHGKNHHVDGSFANHVLSMRLVTPTGAHTISPNSQPELFWGTVGAMGLTGVITEATIQMTPITTDSVLVDTDRYSNLEGVMTAMFEGDANYRYSVAWVDCMTKGKNMGRAILTRGDHAGVDQVTKPTLVGPQPPKISVPFMPPSGLLNRASVRLFNEAWFRVAPQHREKEVQSLSTFFHPLDGVSNWNRMYGKRGFLQYQFAVSDDHSETVVNAIKRLSESGVASFLAVLKRFGAGNASPLSFPIPGWTLALDLPIGSPRLPGILDELDDMVVAAGGRLYFAKDSRLSPEKAQVMYPRLGEFRTLKNRIDPEHKLTSDLARRLRLVGE